MPIRVIAGHDIHVEHRGSSPPVVIFVHPGLGSGNTLSPLIEALGDPPSIVFDLPGHGQSCDARTRYPQMVAADIVRLLAEGPIHVVGHSFGATVALRAVAEDPAIATSLTLIDPVWFAAAAGTAVHAAYKRQMLAYEAAVEKRDIVPIVRAFMDVWSDTPLDVMPFAQQRKYLERMPVIVDAMRELDCDPLGLFQPGGLQHVTCPVTLIEGGSAPPVIAAILDRIEAGLPNVRRCVIPGAGHMVPITHPIQTAAAIPQIAPLRRAG